MSQPSLPVLTTQEPAAGARLLTEEEFAAQVDACRAGAVLTALLAEDHPAYAQRGGDAIVRMRGWLLIRLSQLGIDDSNLAFVLEELESGIHPYLVAAAARALRSYREPRAEFVPFVVRALSTIASSDEPLSFEAYGEYAVAASETTAIGELVLALQWLVPVAAEAIAAIELLATTSLPRRYWRRVNGLINAIRRDNRNGTPRPACCGRWTDSLGAVLFWAKGIRRQSGAIDSITLEDHDGAIVRSSDFFRRRPTIVVFFYTRCENPLKCSLTITKLARIQQLLAERGLSGEIQTAAITYDPGFDHPHRMASYGRDRGLRLTDSHRMLRTISDFNVLRRHFRLGIGFIETLVNRHRLELFILDRQGNTAAQFARLRWDECDVIDRAIQIRNEESTAESTSERTINSSNPDRKRFSTNDGSSRGMVHALTGFIGVVASIGTVFFPKCPLCWAAYLSMFGVVGLGQIPYAPWVGPVLIAALLVNLVSVAWRGCLTGRRRPTYLLLAGTLAILCVAFGFEWRPVAIAGVLCTLTGNIWAVLDPLMHRAPALPLNDQEF